MLSFPGQTAPIINSVSADSLVVAMQVGPNVASNMLVTRITFKGAPQFEYSLASPDSVISTSIPTVPITISPANPQVGDTVTLTAGAGFTFGLTSTVAWPLGATAIVASSTPGALKVLPQPGSSGQPTISNITAASDPLFLLTLPGSGLTPLTMQATSIYGGRGNPALATQLTIPPVGTDTLEFFDLSQNIDQFYGLTFASNQTLAFRLSWPAGPDVDMLWCNATCSGFYGGFAGATGANPEVGTVAFVTAPPGPAFNLYLNLYAGAAPSWIRIRIIRTL